MAMLCEHKIDICIRNQANKGWSRSPTGPPCRSPAVAYQLGDGSRTVKDCVQVSMKGILTRRRPWTAGAQF